jgi:hypothetical protein
LPYKWTQTIGDLDITVEVPGNLKGRDLNVEMKKKKLVLGIKGKDPIISVCCYLLFVCPTGILCLLRANISISQLSPP